MYIYTQRHTETEVRDGKVLKRWRCCPEFASDIMGKGIVSVKALRVPRKKEKKQFVSKKKSSRAIPWARALYRSKPSRYLEKRGGGSPQGTNK